MPLTSPPPYEWLNKEENLPIMVKAGLRNLGRLSITNTVAITGQSFHDHMGHNFSGVWMARTAYQAGFEHSWDPYRPKAWCRFGKSLAEEPDDQRDPVLGDVLVFLDPMNIVCIYVGEDDDDYHVLGAPDENHGGFFKLPRQHLSFVRRLKTDDYSFPGARIVTPDGQLKD